MTTNPTAAAGQVPNRPTYEPTTGAKSERRLARSLGYPRTWHVVRVMPHPADADVAGSGGHSFQDRIYAGDPLKNADLYFNHGAAAEAALNWVEGESTPYDGRGGQLLPRVAKFGKGDEVEVYYEPDETWYRATILRMKQYDDDIRYTVHYTEEDTHQPNVSEEDIRSAPPKRKKSKKKKSESAATETTAAAGTKRKAEGAGIQVDQEQLRVAREMGLPEGYAVKQNKNYKLVIRSPDGRRFTSKRAAFEHAGLEVPPPAGSSTAKKKKDEEEEKATTTTKKKEEGGEEEEKKKKKPTAKKKREKKPDERGAGAEVPPPAAAAVDGNIEDGDPPWRTGGHAHLSRRVRYSPDADATAQLGTVTGWIASTDVDSAGEPGFLSERTGEPAALFHVTFDRPSRPGQGGPGWLESQDFEEYELMDIFVDEDEEGKNGDESDGSSEEEKSKLLEDDDSNEYSEEEGNSSSEDDEVPLSAFAKRKGGEERGAPKKKKTRT